MNSITIHEALVRSLTSDDPRNELRRDAALELVALVDMGHVPGPVEGWMIHLDSHGRPDLAENADAGGRRIIWLLDAHRWCV